MTHPFERHHSIVIAAKPAAVFDYVTNPKSWPEWLPTSHHIDCDDRPMRFGDTFHEYWSTRTAKVELDWLVIACDAPKFVHSAARHDHDFDTAAARFRDRLAYGRIQSVIACDCPVIIQREN